MSVDFELDFEYLNTLRRDAFVGCYNFVESLVQLQVFIFLSLEIQIHVHTRLHNNVLDYNFKINFNLVVTVIEILIK